MNIVIQFVMVVMLCCGAISLSHSVSLTFTYNIRPRQFYNLASESTIMVFFLRTYCGFFADYLVANKETGITINCLLIVCDHTIRIRCSDYITRQCCIYIVYLTIILSWSSYTSIEKISISEICTRGFALNWTLKNTRSAGRGHSYSYFICNTQIPCKNSYI